MQISSLRVTLSSHPIAPALWKRLDTPGYDAAFLFETDKGYELRGTAIFKTGPDPACLAYRVELDHGWRAQAGHVTGEIGEISFGHHIICSRDGWSLNGRLIAGLSHVYDLDFGFTPATNMPALRRAALDVGQAADLPAAWFDLEPPRLVELPQHYRRQSQTQYDYQSPTAGYRAVLELAPSGFIRVYPGLWEMA
jgi:hypothetical protein